MKAGALLSQAKRHLLIRILQKFNSCLAVAAVCFVRSILICGIFGFEKPFIDFNLFSLK